VHFGVNRRENILRRTLPKSPSVAEKAEKIEGLSYVVRFFYSRQFSTAANTRASTRRRGL
jgi:hypothetical protein